MTLKTLWSDFTGSKWFSRKIAVVILGMFAAVLYPESGGAVATIVGLFCGANAAGKFATTAKNITGTVQSAKELADETIKPAQE